MPCLTVSDSLQTLNNKFTTSCLGWGCCGQFKTAAQGYGGGGGGWGRRMTGNGGAADRRADLSKNRFSEVPPEVCDYSSMERLNCYHNIIKSIPEAIIQLQALTHLNLSRNQLTVLPVSLCALTSLEVLLASNNKLVSLPEEIGKLDRLMDLDVSCNEISHLPPQIGDMCCLRSLNLRRNLLVELPLDICKLNLRKLDISSNRIEKIPTVFRKLEMLEVIVLEHNPLSSPPAHICTRGRQHIMKYLHTEAIKEDRKRGILSESDMKRLIRKSLPPQQTSDEFRNILEPPESKWKRHTVLSSDSGYSTADSLDKCGWNHNEHQVTVGDIDENGVLAIKAAEAVREQRQGREGYVQGGANVNTNIPSDIARTRLQAMPPSPSSAPHSMSPFTAGNGGQPVSGPNHQGGAPPNSSPSPASAPPHQSPVRDFGQVPMTTPPSPLSYHHPYHQNHQGQNRGQHPHSHHHQPLHLRQHSSPQLTTYSQHSPSHYHNHAPPPLASIPHSRASPQDFRQTHHLPMYSDHMSHHQTSDEFPPPPAPPGVCGRGGHNSSRNSPHPTGSTAADHGLFFRG
ncbi:hypothetical protein BaRGS_00022305 [Batillaria attramentaria]|uniref:Uncharacterized protein n=1 Tax=Batillaria attramentaria TaxID=370345 RepID=A0ABD0KHL0_9CAEN